MSEMSANFCSFREFFNFGESKKLKGISQVNKEDGPIFVMDFLTRKQLKLNASYKCIVVVANQLVRPEFGCCAPN
jgi:hypothetical protein